MAPNPSDPLPSEPTFPCKICGRKFIKSSLEKHESACKKLATLHRKPFDSGKQRAKGSDITYADVKRAKNEKIKNGGIFPRPQTNWKERHGHFIDAVSSSKRVDYALKTGAPLPPPPKTAVPSDYVQCEYCGRNFNSQAAERHIPFCREQATRKQQLTKSSGARSISGSYRNLPSKQETRSFDNSQRNNSVTRGRDGSLSRSRNDLSNDLTNRRKSLDTRSNLTSSQIANRNVSQSAGSRQSQLPPTTPSKRSNSASRNTTSQRMKTPAPEKRSSSKNSTNSRSSSRRDQANKTSESRLSAAKENSRNASRSRLF